MFRLRDLLRRSLHLRPLKQSGNVFFMLFGAVAIAGLIGVSTMTTMKGSMRGVAQSNQIAAANNTLYSAARLIAGAAQGEDDDCDSDGIVEPPPWRDAGAVPAPAGGGLVPGHIGAGKRDPWGADIGYCVWDHGNRTVSHAVTACGGAGANRLEGTDEKTEYVIAVISAGPDRIFQTVCNPWADADDDGQPDTPLIVTAPGSDDIVRAETITALFAEGNTNQLQQLPDEACTPDTVGTLRYDAGTMQVCRETGWQEVGGAILASGNFLPVTGAALNSEHTSNDIAFTGFFGTRTASVDGGAILIVNGVESGSSASIEADDTIALKSDAASAPATTATFTLSVSTLRRTWTITTRDPTPAALVMTPAANGTMDVTGPGSPAYGSTVRFTVRNSGETPSAVLAAAQLSNSTNFTFDASGANVGDACSGQTLAHNETCFIDVRPRASDDGTYSGALSISDGTVSDDSALSGTATGWSCTVAAGTTWTVGGSTCTVPSALNIASGGTAGTTDSASPTVGSATYACSAAVATLQAGATCITEDTTPAAFSFTDQTNQQLNTLRTSNTITITGINTGTAVSVSGAGSPQISIDGGGWVTSGTISNGDTLRVRLTSANAFSSARSATVNVGGVTDSWSVTTRAASGCSNTTMRWTNASSGPCRASSGTMSHGQSKSVNNTASGYSGSRNLSCNDGTISQSGGSCTASLPSCDIIGRGNCQGALIQGDSGFGITEASCRAYCETVGGTGCCEFRGGTVKRCNAYSTQAHSSNMFADPIWICD